MQAQTTKQGILHTIADIQKALSIQQVEDAQIAEESGLNLHMVRRWLYDLAEEGYVQLITFETLLGTVYDVSLTSQGKRFLEKEPMPA